MNGNQFRDFRTDILGLKQSTLAERLGVHRATIGRIERGELEADLQMRLACAALALGITDYDGGPTIEFTLEPSAEGGIRREQG